ncbi:MAG: hypothetical protein CL424_19440 [Acidimicrobiaceae bacterium]|nr:hypothetical protein [Acidimicrobiaceae bacterium]
MASRTTPRRISTLVTVVAVGMLGACGGDDDTDTAPDTGTDTGAESGVPPTAPPNDADSATDSGATATTAVDGGVEVDEVPDDPAELAEPTGTITVADQTWEVAGFAQALEDGEFVQLDGDFLICEADNPAFPGDANIIVGLDDDLEFSFGISDGEPRAEFGESIMRETATTVDFERVDRTITGTAQFTDAGAAEFDITCG